MGSVEPILKRLDELHTAEELKANHTKKPMERRVFPAGKDKKGNTVFEIRHKARGSSVEDSVENGLEKILKTLEAWK